MPSPKPTGSPRSLGDTKRSVRSYHKQTLHRPRRLGCAPLACLGANIPEIPAVYAGSFRSVRCSMSSTLESAMECPQCKSTNVKKCSWDTMTGGDKAMELWWRAAHRGPQAPATLLTHLGSWGAKLAMSSVHYCNACGHLWRKWF
jgi:hypothetical protein